MGLQENIKKIKQLRQSRNEKENILSYFFKELKNNEEDTYIFLKNMNKKIYQENGLIAYCLTMTKKNYKKVPIKKYLENLKTVNNLDKIFNDFDKKLAYILDMDIYKDIYNKFVSDYSKHNNEGLYGYFKISDVDKRKTVILIDKKEELELPEILSFGLTGNGYDSSDGYEWIVQRGELKNGHKISNFDRKYNYFSYYPNNEKNFNILMEKYDVKIYLED